MFIDRSKVEPTNDKMMRMVKRERFLSLIISGYMSGNVSIYRTNPTPDGIKRKDMPWHESMLTTVQIRHHISERNVFDHKLKLINETGWIDDEKIHLYEEDNYLIAEITGIKKLRLYYDWMFKSKSFFLQKVIKYMYSHLILSFFIVDKIATYDGETMVVYVDTLSRKDQSLLQEWLKVILGADSTYDADSGSIAIKNIDSTKLKGEIEQWQT